MWRMSSGQALIFVAAVVIVVALLLVIVDRRARTNKLAPVVFWTEATTADRCGVAVSGVPPRRKTWLESTSAEPSACRDWNRSTSSRVSRSPPRE